MTADLFGIGPFLFEDPRERSERAKLTAFLKATGLAGFSRDPTLGGHVTGSAFVLSPDGGSVLLTHHAKLDRWLQLGGHCDGICDVRFVALKEAYEESGLAHIRMLKTEVLDLDIHVIPASAKEREHLHYDLRFLMQAEVGDLHISSESKALKWVPLDQLEQYSTDPSVLRLRNKARDFGG
ncbi:NUDIX hydrolase [Pelagimonas varians]|uniref:NUDIX domain protein n=1 Tax=Pelagimonas varians TaxID=696760 RepID=A0A238JUJ1_9RHOB|nr:NUDIX hydrolase [Pelagimonas varians]PYG34492.1 8-oxo-dGTP pyrophosphatase MutT (NUDIX family) [Pelagimonas varians]SMX33867.1 NUDIX domain protein [Pelagimonas varians]